MDGELEKLEDWRSRHAVSIASAGVCSKRARTAEVYGKRARTASRTARAQVHSFTAEQRVGRAGRGGRDGGAVGLARGKASTESDGGRAMLMLCVTAGAGANADASAAAAGAGAGVRKDDDGEDTSEEAGGAQALGGSRDEIDDGRGDLPALHRCREMTSRFGGGVLAKMPCPLSCPRMLLVPTWPKFVLLVTNQYRSSI